MILPEAIASMVKPLVAAFRQPACHAAGGAVVSGSSGLPASTVNQRIVTGIMNPFWMANLASNQAALAPAAIPHTFLPGFWITICLSAASAPPLPLAFLLMRSKRRAPAQP